MLYVYDKACYVCVYFLGAFAKLRKATVGFSPSGMEQLGSHWTDFDEI